jgi:hypothetical protein
MVASALVTAVAACGTTMHSLPTYTGDSCLDAKLGPVAVHVDAAKDPPVWVASASGNRTIFLEWPSGFRIARDNGTWAVLDRSGHVVVDDEGTLTVGGGSYSRAGQDWWEVSVCSVGGESLSPP